MIIKTLVCAIGLAVGVNEYYNLDQITKDPYQEQNEELQPAYTGGGTPEIAPLECGIEKVVPLDSYMGNTNTQNRLEHFFFDTDGDGIRDVLMAVPEGDENRHPLLYFFDRDYDGEPDIAYVDNLRDGSCKNIGIYWTPAIEREHEKPGGIECQEGKCYNKGKGEREL